jgi:uncharacterized membrane protein
MPVPHPSKPVKISLQSFLWRYFTGHHLDGKARTDATWFKPGKTPTHHVNWWNSKPRAHRALWRWGTVTGPVAWITVYLFTPSIRINITLLISLTVLPYLFHNVTVKFTSMLPKRHVVIVHDHVTPDDISELDEMKEVSVHPMAAFADLDITDEIESKIVDPNVSSKPRKGRSS